MGGDTPPALLGGQVVGDRTLDAGDEADVTGDRVGDGRHPLDVGDVGDVPGEGDGGRVEQQRGPRRQVVADGPAAGGVDERVESLGQAHVLGGDDGGDQVGSIGEHLVDEADRAAGLGGQAAHGQSSGPVASDDVARRGRQLGAQLCGGLGGTPCGGHEVCALCVGDCELMFTTIS